LNLAGAGDTAASLDDYRWRMGDKAAELAQIARSLRSCGKLKQE
jgi:hypothetical protein